MAKFRGLLAIVAIFGLSMGGCPIAGTPGGTSTENPSTTPDSTSNPTTTPTIFSDCHEPTNLQAWQDEVLRLVNEERQNAGLNPVTRDETLEQQADQYACELLHYDFFAHENPETGTTLADRAEQFGYSYTLIGENLAAGQVTPAQVMADWMASPGHRENILEPEFTELGVGIRAGGRYSYYWVQEFGRPSN